MEVDKPYRADEASGRDSLESGEAGIVDAGLGVVKVDEVFGPQTESGPNYRDLGWLGTSVLMIKTQLGVGVLSIPSVLITLGIVPGIICILGLSSFTGWANYQVGRFKRAHPDVYSVDDVGFMLGGKVGRELMALFFWLSSIFVAGASLLGASIALNSITNHGTCTAVFVAVATVVTFILASIRTLGKVSWLGWLGLGSILAAVITLAVSVGVSDRPEDAPPTGPWDKDLVIFGNPSFLEAASALSVLLFSFGGTPAYFGIVSEMREPRLFNRSMLTAHFIVTATYTVIGVVVYAFVGQYVSSPALGSAGVLMKRVCFGIALPGLLVTAILFTHLPAKLLFVRVLRGSEHLTSNSIRHWVTWLSCTFGCVICSYIIASAIPVFNSLIGIIGSVFGTLLTMHLMGACYLYDNWHLRFVDKSARFRILFVWNLVVIACGTFLMVAGTYSSVVDIKNSLKAGGTEPFTCADNS